jgi:hypothetical protein
MKFRKPQLPAPPQSPDTGEMQAARAMAAAINQGLPGGHFCRLMHTMDAAPVRAAAGMTTDQLKEWFMQDDGARNILRGVPNFMEFVTAFHAAARELYPTAPPPNGKPA